MALQVATPSAIEYPQLCAEHIFRAPCRGGCFEMPPARIELSMKSSYARRSYEPGDEPIPGYRLSQPLGRGGMGEVWKARSAGGIEVALKIIDGVDRVAGRKEFRGLQVVKNVKHPNLCPIIGFWLKDSDGNILEDSESLTQQLVQGQESEYGPADDVALHKRDTATTDEKSTDPDEVPATDLRGTLIPSSLQDSEETQPAQLLIAMGIGDQTLADQLEQCTSEGGAGVPVDELLECLEGCAKAIDLLNVRYNIQHCDIKPQNILLVGGDAQVCDFGLAKQMDDHRRTTTNAYTIAYAAPEVIEGREPTRWTDQYSLAISYVELRTGSLPYFSETLPSVIKAKETGNLNLSSLTKRERKVIQRAASRKPEDRYENCVEMVRALREAFQVEPRKNSLVGNLAMVVVLLLVTAGAAGYWIWPEAYHSVWAMINGDPELPRNGGGEVVPPDPGIEDRLAARQDFESGRWAKAFAKLDPLLVKDPNDEKTVTLWREFIETLARTAQSRMESEPELAVTQLQLALQQIESHPDSIDPKTGSAIRIGVARALLRSPQPVWAQVLEQTSALRASADQLTENDHGLTLCLSLLARAEGDASRLFQSAMLDDLAQLVVIQGAGAKSTDREFERLAQLKRSALDLWQRGKIDVPENDPRVASIWPGGLKLALLLADAERQLNEKKPDFEAVEKELQQATLLAADKPGVQARVLDLMAWLMLARPDDQLENVLPTIRAALSNPLTSHPDRLVELVSERVESLAASSIVTADLINATGTLLDEARDRIDMRRWTELAERRKVWRLVAAITDPQPDYARWQSESAALRAAGNDDVLIAAVFVESRVQVDPSAWDKVRSELNQLAIADSSPYACYLTYVRGLVESLQPGRQHLDAAATLFADAYRAPSAASLLSADSRRRVASINLLAAARGLHASTGDGLDVVPFDQKPKADQALAYLQLLGTLGSELPPTFHADFAKAAFYSTQRQDLLARIIMECEGVYSSHGEETPENVLLVWAWALRDRGQPNDLPKAVDTVAAAVQRWWARNSGHSSDRLPVFQQVLQPALQLAGQLGPPAAPQRQSLARVYGCSGLLVLRDLSVEQQLRDEKKQPATVAYEWLKKANSLADPPIPEYLVGQGRALVQRVDQDEIAVLDETRQLAEQALGVIDADVSHPALAGASSLQGYSMVLQSRHEARQRAKSNLLEQAVAAYRASVDKRNEADPDYAEYLGGMSAAHLESAFFGCEEGRWWHLKQAVAYAEQACDVEGRSHEDTAYIFLGNGHEDESYYLFETGKYQDAIDSFQTALELARKNFRPTSMILLSLGRTRFRRVFTGASQNASEDLAQSLQRLKEGLAAATTDAERAKISMWISKVHLQQALIAGKANEELFQTEWDLAEQTAAGAVEMAWKNVDPAWPEYQAHLIQLSGVKNENEKGRERAQHLLDVAGDPNGKMRVRPAFVYQATSALIALETIKSWQQWVESFDRYLPYFPEDSPAGPKYLIEWLIGRAKPIATSQTTGQQVPEEIYDVARKDLIRAQALSDKLDCGFDRSGVTSRAFLLRASLDFHRFIQEYYQKNIENKASQELLEATITNSISGFNELHSRLERMEGQLPRENDPQQLTSAQQSEWLQYAQRWRKRNIESTIESRRVFARSVLLLAKSGVNRPLVQSAIAPATNLLGEVKPQHLPTNNEGKARFQELKSLATELEKLSSSN